MDMNNFCECQPGRCELADANRDGLYCKIYKHEQLRQELALALIEDAKNRAYERSERGSGE